MPMEFVTQNVLLVSLVVVSGLSLLWPAFARPSGNGVNPGEATLLINREDAVIIDVREPDEYAAGHLPESRNIPAGKLEERVGELEKYKDTPLILVCQSGARSAGSCARLGKLGFAKTHNLAGGVGAWVEAGLPIRKGGRK